MGTLKSEEGDSSSMTGRFTGLNASVILPEVEERADENISSREAKTRKSIIMRKKMTTQLSKLKFGT